MRRPITRLFVPFALLAISSSVFALGLGELRGRPSLGEKVHVEIDILGDAKAPLDASCFRLVPPGGGDLPWLRRANLSLRKGSPWVLDIRSDTPLREPVIQLAVQMGCGNELVKEYVILASPEVNTSSPQYPATASELRPARETVASKPQAPRVRKPVAAPVDAPARLMPVKPEKLPVTAQPDRILLSAGGDVGEPSLRLSSSLFLAEGAKEVQEAQRDILRLEYRMLVAMNEQATNQLETAEKLRNMEATLGELQAKAGDVARNTEQGAAPVAPPAPEKPAAQPSAPVAAVEESDDWSEWSLYGVLLGALLGVGGWLGWRRYQERRQLGEADDDLMVIPEPLADPKREGEREEPGGVDLSVEPAAMGAPMAVDFELDAAAPAHSEAETAAKGAVLDSLMSISATTLDEHFEASPVMELADIMLSFGRVKGAAQALQEYIDNNPQEALQPWIRLMDVYRMAGMREEFEAVARNLNQNFNVEIQRWESPEAAVEKDAVVEPAGEGELLELDVPALPVAPRPTCLEDMPRIMKMICEQWREGDVVGYLYQLLRDNRGGQRIGFALPVVEEILFLVELRETANRMEKDHAPH